jgi:SOS regulatory protein LexA
MGMPKKDYQGKILAFYRSHRRMPSITEVMKLCSFKSRSSAFYLIEKLSKGGILEKDAQGKVVPSPEMHTLRVLGNIRAGFAAPAEEELADTITVGEYLIKHKESSYLLKVEGDSMKDAGIMEGDMVIFERRGDAKPGDIVVALTEDGYTLKFLRKKGVKLYLEAANDEYPNIYPAEGQIIGVVTSTFRTYKP